jgi:death-on-curing protein
MSAPSTNPIHLTVERFREIHQQVIKRFGGSDGIRDYSLLESAVSAPQATFGGDSLYKDRIEIAAAYLFYICRNHPFIDGNKRVALGACIIFLKTNGYKPKADGPEWESLILDVAASRLDRDQTTERLRALVHQPAN